VQGTGLGLALPKGPMEAMGGTLVAHSVQGEGTTFTLELPVAEDRRDELLSAPQE
jgi:signal transduction histidine kinase